jgi:hypothetical protein
MVLRYVKMQRETGFTVGVLGHPDMPFVGFYFLVNRDVASLGCDVVCRLVLKIPSKDINGRKTKQKLHDRTVTFTRRGH